MYLASFGFFLVFFLALMFDNNITSHAKQEIILGPDAFPAVVEVLSRQT